jgi:predicted molibdopterin-dependent oxidoreductase YjgC
VPVSWVEALGDIAQRFNAILDRDGGSAILHTHYTGTCSLIAGTFPLRFFNHIGATEVDPDTVCNKAGHAALQLMYGESTRGFDPRTIDGARCVMVWGANPSASAPHVHQYWLAETRAPKIVVDPIRHETAATADIHLQLYPGTEGARLRNFARHIRGRPHRSCLPRRARGRLGGDRTPVAGMHSGLGRSDDRRAGAPHRAGCARLRSGPLSVVDGTGVPAPVVWR